MTQRRTQLERRTETRQQVLEAACRCFGEKGFARTSLEDIAQSAGVTIRPVYHYFGNKKQLFAAVTEFLEQRLVDALDEATNARQTNVTKAGWQAFMNMTQDKAFRQVVLVDAPVVLGRERWAESAVIKKVRTIFRHIAPAMSEQKSEWVVRMMIAAMAEAALMTAEMPENEASFKEVGAVMDSLLRALLSGKG